MTERRRFLRFETALNALCEIVTEKHKESSRVKNLSKEGALVIVSRPLGHGTQLNLSMDVPGDNVPIIASGQVAWQRPLRETNSDYSYETGIKFTKIDNHDRGRLLEYIYTRWLKLMDKA